MYNQIDSGMPRTFNNALYFVRNGSKLVSSKWSVDQQDFPVKDIYDIHNENLRHWGKFGKPDTIYKVFKQYITSKKKYLLMY